LVGKHGFQCIEQLPLTLRATFTVMHALVHRKRSTVVVNENWTLV
jgi:hypothetical protein